MVQGNPYQAFVPYIPGQPRPEQYAGWVKMQFPDGSINWQAPPGNYAYGMNQLPGADDFLGPDWLSGGAEFPTTNLPEGVRSNEVYPPVVASGAGGVLNQATGDRMQDIFDAAGIPWGALTPSEQFGAYATTQFRPRTSGLRSAFYDVQQPLLQQYYLQQPMMTSAYPDYTGPTYGGFRDFMEGGFAGQENIRDLAEQAAVMARMPEAQFFEYVSPDVLEDVDPDTGQYVRTGEYAGPAITGDMATWNPVTGRYEGGELGGLSRAQQLLYRQTYGTGQQAAANQAQLANLLALQRGGGDLYGGPMGQAITGALGELQSQLMARNPEANFLDWYLDRTRGGQGPGGFLPGDGYDWPDRAF